MNRPDELPRESVVLDRTPLSPRTFQAIRNLLYAHSGIALAPHKLTMVQSRLAKRLRVLGLTDYESYLERVSDPASEEWGEFINALTTNLTSFFREGHHFTRLVELLEAQGPPPLVRVWSAGCSTGEEPYTLAMTLHKAFGGMCRIEIVATDLDTSVLETAARGVYPLARLENVAEPWKHFGFLRGTGRQEGQVRIRPELRGLITFERLNLLDPRWPLGSGPIHAIFCRNVMIYFDKPTQRNLLARFHQRLERDGLLFVGHSEALLDAASGFHPLGQTVYQRKDGKA
ncbi:protein-glutamate O-methyltransferase CheR [Geothrix sp. 21YS21S-4]|uniref:CheR family methyltransferase n=1 Tax=Geothrix sp. 21YS21S-4 TaxID=3068889 RepID=UPI0027B8D06B|nr:CheR family methyltransferase [Geothrix sp. 21YS21S-4]